MRDKGLEPYQKFFKGLKEQSRKERQERAQKMPTQEDAFRQIYEAYHRLKELGWKDAKYCPKDGSLFDAYEAGCIEIQTASYVGTWPDGSIFAHDKHDSYPSRPILFRGKSKYAQEN